MGQAKRRGSEEQRRAQAITAARVALPESVKCNECQADLTEIEPMNLRGMVGLRAAGLARCGCGCVTWVVDGTSEAKEAFAEFMSAEHGDGLKVGTATKDA
jgi:hypothetical protein